MMLPPRLLVIDPSIVYPETEGTATILAGWAGEAEVRQPSLRPGDGPGPGFGYDYDGVVLMGSKASVEDEHSWLRDLSAWLDPILDGRKALPLFGICFGHQLIAARAGASIGHVRPDRRLLLGEESSVLEGGRLIPGRTELRVVASHCEEVKSLPGGYRVTARRSGIPIDMATDMAMKMGDAVTMTIRSSTKQIEAPPAKTEAPKTDAPKTGGK